MPRWRISQFAMSSTTVPDLYEKILALDLHYLIEKACSEHYPLPRWQIDQATKALSLYKRFLFLLITYPQEKLVPTRDIDEFWHNHILYTKRYAHDCQNLCGHYIHHFPSNPNDSEDMQNISKNFELTQALYLKEFGEELQVLMER